MFELHITCSKDIDKLSIDFSDGTTLVNEKPLEKTKEHKETKKKISKVQENQIEGESNDFDNFKPYVSNKEVMKPIELPEISDRPAKIDEILDNLDF